MKERECKVENIGKIGNIGNIGKIKETDREREIFIIKIELGWNRKHRKTRGYS